MDELALQLVRRMRPRVGWVAPVLGFTAALAPSFAAQSSALDLPAGLFGWAGALAFLLGMAAPLGGRGVVRAARVALWLALTPLGVAFLLCALGEVFPPFGLLLRDTRALGGWLLRELGTLRPAEPPPASLSAIFMSDTLPRFWRDLLAAPDGGERGARLLVAAGGLAVTWLGALALGRAIVARRSLLGWGLPLLAATAATTVLGVAAGYGLVIGMALLLLLAVYGEASRRDAAWDRAGADYSGELRRDAFGWGSGLVLVTLMLAWLIPGSLDSPLAQLLWRDVEPPSGIAALEKQMNAQRPRTPVVQPGLSQLPSVQLGQSLERGSSNAPALRVRLSEPLPDSPYPHYWRARLLSYYSGSSWRAAATVDPQRAVPLAGLETPGMIRQTIEDLRGDRTILPALPDAIALDVPTNAERLADGTLAALTVEQPIGRYQVISRLQEQAAPPPADVSQAPDLSAYLALPRTVPARVATLARTITSDARTPAEQALALERYLRELPYDYQVAPVPNAGDAVDQFLFEMRRGYCTYYASAMAVMARSLGIPSRVAIGYATGEYERQTASYLVRERDAHAWPELYIDGRWLPFEPTPIRPLPNRAAPVPTPVSVPVEVAAPAPQTGPLIWLAVLAALALAGFLLWRRPRPERVALRVQRELERLGARAGVPWAAGTTLREYGANLAARRRRAAPELAQVTDLIGQERYGPTPLEPDDERRLETTWSRVREIERTEKRGE